MHLDRLNQQAFSTYLRYKKNKPLGDKSIAKYIGILNICLPFWKTYEYSYENLLLLYENERARGITNETLKNYKKLYTHIDNYLKKQKVLTESISSEIGVGKTAEKDFFVFSVTEIERLTHAYLPNRDNVLYNTAYMAFSEIGGRPSAILPIPWERFNFANKTLDIYNPKTNTWRTKVISNELTNAIQSLPRRDERIFPISAPRANEDIKLRSKAVGIISDLPISLKSFRQSLGTQSVEDDIHWNDIMDRLDHSDPKSLRTYIKKSKKSQQRFMHRSSITKNRLSKPDRYMHYLARYRELKDEMASSGMTIEEIKNILTGSEYQTTNISN